MHWLMFAAVVVLSGCDNFFVPEKGTGGAGSTTVGGSGANYAYVLNTASGSVSGFLIGTGTITPTLNSPYPLGFLPQGAVVTRANNFLYVSGAGAIYAFPIKSDGSLSTSAQAAAVAIGSELALAVSPDGQWLFGLNSQSSTLDEWKIDKASGVITAMPSAAYTVTDAVSLPLMLRVSPTANYVFAALGTGGDQVFTLDTSTGAVASTQHLSLGSPQTSDNSLVVDSTGTKLYIARSGVNGGVAVYTIGAAGQLVQIPGSPFASGLGTFDVTLDSTGKYVYAANRTDGTISGYSVGTGGSLAALNGSPYISGKVVSSLIADRSGKYLIAAAAGGSPDVTLYGFDPTIPGKLNILMTAVSGSDPAGSTLVAPVH